MSPYRLAAIDLDDTLLGPDRTISAANAAAVERLRERGIQVVLASGRRHENMLRFHRQLGLAGPIVSCNGALVKHAETGEVYHEDLVPAALAGEVLAEGDARGIAQNFYHTDGGLYVHEETVWTELYRSRTGSELTVHGDLRGLVEGGQGPLKILWIDAGERIAEILPAITDQFGDRLYLTVTEAEYLEFMSRTVTKAAGVAKVAATYGFDAAEVMAFGDGNNDVPLLEWAGLGVAMDNARESAKAAADRVAPSGDPETSLARAIAAVLGEV